MSIADRLARRLGNALRFPRVRIVDDSGPVQKVQADYGPIDASGASLGLRDGTPVCYFFGFSSNPPAGADAVLKAVRGDLGNAVIVGTNHQQYRLRGLPSGATALYDQFGNTIVLGPTGITLTPGAGLTVKVNGDLVATGTITGQTDVKAGSEPVSLATHKHTGVTAGVAETGEPA